eukprot:g4314.t1
MPVLRTYFNTTEFDFRRQAVLDLSGGGPRSFDNSLTFNLGRDLFFQVEQNTLAAMRKVYEVIHPPELPEAKSEWIFAYFSPGTVGGRSACERLQAELDTWNNTESDMLILEIDGLFWEPLNVARYNVDVLVLCGSTSFLGDFLIQASAINLRFQALVTNLPAGAGKIFSYGAPLVNYILEPLPLGAILPTATDAVFGSLETFAQDLGDEPDVASLQVTVVASTGNFETLFGIRGQWKPAFRQFLPSNDAALLPYDAPLAPGPLNSNVILVLGIPSRAIRMKTVWKHGDRNFRGGFELSRSRHGGLAAP